jgi:hypothetical protein
MAGVIPVPFNLTLQLLLAASFAVCKNENSPLLCRFPRKMLVVFPITLVFVSEQDARAELRGGRSTRSRAGKPGVALHLRGPA